MPDRLHLYVSAGPDLEGEREVIGRTIAQMPLSIGWSLKRTPLPGESPVGAEWDLARRTGRTTLAYLKDVGRTPAALVFARDAHIPWISFRTPEELGQKLEAEVARILVDRVVDMGLTLPDWEKLNALLKRSDPSGSPATTEGQRESGGAGGGGIILAPGRDLPPGGVVVNVPAKPHSAG